MDSGGTVGRRAAHEPLRRREWACNLLGVLRRGEGEGQGGGMGGDVPVVLGIYFMHMQVAAWVAIHFCGLVGEVLTVAGQLAGGQLMNRYADVSGHAM